MTLYLILFLTSSLGTQLFRAYALKVGLLDVPNARSSHQVSTPRGGGIVFVVLSAVWALGAYWANMITPHHALILLPAILVAGIGFWDDRQSISAKKRLLCHVIAALGCVLALGGVSIFVGLIAVAALTWSTNLFNFMDGTDGLAAVEAMFVFGFGAWFLNQVGASDLSLWAACLTALIAGFLRWNWPKASIFMGDGASGFLGFMIATLAIVAYLEYQLSPLYILMLYGPFWFDASVTLMRRILLKHSILSAHKLHAYQRLHQSGFSHAQVLWCVIGLNSLLAILAVWAYHHSEHLRAAFLVALLVLTVAMLWVEKRKPLQG